MNEDQTTMREDYQALSDSFMVEDSLSVLKRGVRSFGNTYGTEIQEYLMLDTKLMLLEIAKS